MVVLAEKQCQITTATILESFFHKRIVARLEFMVTLGSEVFVLLNQEKKIKNQIKKNQKSLQKINFSVKFYAIAFITGFKLIQKKHVWYKYLLTKVRLFFKKQGENQLPFYFWRNLISRAVRYLLFIQARGLFLPLLYFTYQLF